MIIFVLILLGIVLYNTKLTARNHYNTEYMSIGQTNAIKGIFVIMVLLGHSNTFVDVNGVLDIPYLALRSHLGQMVVAVFLFYSGYGMMKSIMKKKYDYVKDIPLKRLLVVFIDFDIAVLLYVILNLILNKSYGWKTTLLSFVAWEEIGNSNWYMLVIFGLYIMMYLSFLILKYDDKAIYTGLVLFVILSVLFVCFELFAGKERWYYNTVVLFPLGSCFALFQKQFENILKEDKYFYTVLCIIMGVMYVGTCRFKTAGLPFYTAWACTFTLCILLLTLKFSIRSPLLEWFGKHVFSIYILQRIPMNILSHVGFAKAYPYLFVVVVFVLTIGISVVYDYFIGKLNALIRKRS